MVELSALKDGDVLYSVFKERAGNTTMSRTVVRELSVGEIKPLGAYLDGSPSGRRYYSASQLKALRRTKPKVVGRI